MNTASTSRRRTFHAATNSGRIVTNDGAGTHVPRRKLFVRRVLYGMRPAEAWRFVNPNSKSNDKSAAELTRREIQWYERNRDSLSQRFGWFSDVIASSPSPSKHEAKRAVRPRR